ncbi:MarR family transcriptional regulator [Priestia megaterium]|nr:MarR family transcriptional regulator [Priestia megaterium]
MNKKDLFDKFMAFTASVHRVTHELTKDVKLELNTVTPVQYSILEYIAVSQPVTPSQVSDCQHMSMPNTSRELKKLSEKNLIEKFSDTKDRRKQYIRLSKDGEIMMNKAFKCTEIQFLNRIQNRSEEDLEDINRALDTLHTKLFY